MRPVCGPDARSFNKKIERHTLQAIRAQCLELRDGDAVGLEPRLEVGERLLSDPEDRDPAPELHDVVLDLLDRLCGEVVLVCPLKNPLLS